MPTNYPGIRYISGEEIVTGRVRHRTAQQGGWKDLLGHYTQRVSGPTIPLLTTVGLSVIQLPSWQLNDLSYYSFHIPHDYAIGTDIYFHVHWMSGGTSTDTVKWQITYYYARGYGIDAFGMGGAGTVITIEEAPTGITYAHMLSESTPKTIVNLEPDAYLHVELKRITNGATDNANAIFAWNLDIHYQSIEESTANRNGPWNS